MKRALLFVAFVCLVSLGCQTHSRMANRQLPERVARLAGHGQYARLRRRVQYRQGHPTTCRRSPRTTASKLSRPDRRPRTYAYPYYTVRGPRDFFLNAPSTIGY